MEYVKFEKNEETTDTFYVIRVACDEETGARWIEEIVEFGIGPWKKSTVQWLARYIKDWGVQNLLVGDQIVEMKRGLVQAGLKQVGAI